MTPGYFFAAQDYAENAFFYKKVIRNYPQGNIDDFPITVVLHREAAVFYFHGFRPGNLETSDQFWQYYGVGKMFMLPFSQDTSQETEQTLIHIATADGGTEDPDGKNDDYLFDRKIYKKQQNHLPGTPVYSGLNALAGGKTGTTGVRFREILLDFLFDFFQSNVFISYSGYTALRARILENIFARAIFLKSEHYYYCRLLEPPEAIAGRRMVTEKKAEHATRSWLSFLRSEMGTDVVKPGNGWFDDVEMEHRAVYKNDDRNILKKESEDSVQWLLGRYDLWGASRLQFFRIFSGFSRIIIALTAFAFFLWWLLTEWYHWNNHWLYLDSNAPCIWGLTCLTMLLVALPVGVFVERFLLFWCTVLKFLLKREEWKSIPSLPEFFLSLPKIVRFFKPKILLASFSIWAFLLATDYAWDLDARISAGHWIVISFFVLCMLLLLAAQFNQLMPMTSKWRRFGMIVGRSALIVVMATVYSFIFGLSGMSLVAKNKLAKSGDLAKYFSDKNAVSRLDSTGLVELSAITGKIPGFSTQDSLIQQEQKNLVLNKLDTIHLLLRPTDKDIFEKVLPHLHHDPEYKHQVFFTGNLSINLHIVTLQWKLYALTDVLLFLTFVAASLGIILEMGFKSL